MASAEVTGRDSAVTPKQCAGGIDLHADDAHAALRRLDQHGSGERQAMDIGRIECDEHGIEVEPAHGFEQDGRVVMPGQAEEPDASLGTRLDKRLECTATAEDHLEVARSSQIVQLPQVEVVGAQPLEAFIEKPERAIAGAVVGLGGKEDLAAALAQGGTVVVEAAGVGGAVSQ